MEIIKDLNSNHIERKLSNGFTEVKCFKSRLLGIYEHFFMNENNKFHGKFSTYRHDRTPLIVCYYKNGKLHGDWKWYYDNGQLREHDFYKNGEKHGECKKYSSKGVLYGHYLYENGELIKDLLYENNKGLFEIIKGE